MIRTRILAGHFARTEGWFRLFGYGLAWKDTRKHRPLFSERNGYARCWRCGPWLVTWLRPYRRPTPGELARFRAEVNAALDERRKR